MNDSLELKDEMLFRLSEAYNIARFISFSPELKVRFSTELGINQSSPNEVGKIMENFLGDCKSVNIRTFLPNLFSGNPFAYGITSGKEALEKLIAFAKQGYFCIVNETISVHDGGVSGVVDQGIVEFSPDDTPRAVEKSGTCALPVNIANHILERVYGLPSAIPSFKGQRVEFSIHPKRVGCRRERILIWETSTSEMTGVEKIVPNWPNNFSRLVGDKVFGLLIADSCGLPVPFGTVIGRRVAPFTFGSHTGSQETWIRTAPVVQQPGRFTTTFDWVDPFALMHTEDPSNSEIQSLIFQEAVPAMFSGATLRDGDLLIIEGVEGKGDDFMSGIDAPMVLPDNIITDVKKLVANAEKFLTTEVRIEWVHDGKKAWIVQLHNHISKGKEPFQLDTSRVSNWINFDPDLGIAALTEFIKNINVPFTGIKLTKPVGITSHIGDLLRKNRINFVIESQ